MDVEDSEAEDFRSQQRSRQRKLQEVGAGYDAFKSQKDTLQRKLNERLDDYVNRVNELEQQKAAYEDLINKLEKTVLQKREQFESKEVQLETLEDEITKQTSELNEKNRVLRELTAELTSVDKITETILQKAGRTISYSAYAREVLINETPVFLLDYLNKNYPFRTESTEGFLAEIEGEVTKWKETLQNQIGAAYVNRAEDINEQTLYNGAIEQLDQGFDGYSNNSYEDARTMYDDIIVLLKKFYTNEEDQKDLKDLETVAKSTLNEVYQELLSDKYKELRTVFDVDNLYDLAQAREFTLNLFKQNADTRTMEEILEILQTDLQGIVKSGKNITENNISQVFQNTYNRDNYSMLILRAVVAMLEGIYNVNEYTSIAAPTDEQKKSLVIASTLKSIISAIPVDFDIDISKDPFQSAVVAGPSSSLGKRSASSRQPQAKRREVQK